MNQRTLWISALSAAAAFVAGYVFLGVPDGGPSVLGVSTAAAGGAGGAGPSGSFELVPLGDASVVLFGEPQAIAPSTYSDDTGGQQGYGEARNRYRDDDDVHDDREDDGPDDDHDDDDDDRYRADGPRGSGMVVRELPTDRRSTARAGGSR